MRSHERGRVVARKLSFPRAARCACALVALSVVAPVFAQDAATALKANRDRLEAVETRAKALQSDVSQIDAERARLNAQLQETARLIQRSEGQMTSIEARRDELGKPAEVAAGFAGSASRTNLDTAARDAADGTQSAPGDHHQT